MDAVEGVDGTLSPNRAAKAIRAAFEQRHRTDEGAVGITTDSEMVASWRQAERPDKSAIRHRTLQKICGKEGGGGGTLHLRATAMHGAAMTRGGNGR